MATLHNIVSDNIYTVLLPIEPEIESEPPLSDYH